MGDRSGTISLEEFEGCLNSEVSMLLQAVGIRTEQAHQLFHLLDLDDSGEIEWEEFVLGCFKLEGGVKAIDFAAFLREWRGVAQRLEAFLHGAGVPESAVSTEYS